MILSVQICKSLAEKKMCLTDDTKNITFVFARV